MAEVKEGFGNYINMCRDRGLNPRPPAQRSVTLPLDHQVTRQKLKLMNFTSVVKKVAGKRQKLGRRLGARGHRLLQQMRNLKAQQGLYRQPENIERVRNAIQRSLNCYVVALGEKDTGSRVGDAQRRRSGGRTPLEVKLVIPCKHSMLLVLGGRDTGSRVGDARRLKVSLHALVNTRCWWRQGLSNIGLAASPINDKRLKISLAVQGQAPLHNSNLRSLAGRMWPADRQMDSPVLDHEAIEMSGEPNTSLNLATNEDQIRLLLLEGDVSDIEIDLEEDEGEEIIFSNKSNDESEQPENIQAVGLTIELDTAYDEDLDDVPLSERLSYATRRPSVLVPEYDLQFDYKLPRFISVDAVDTEDELDKDAYADLRPAMGPAVKMKKGVGVGRKPPDEALKNPGPEKQPAPREKKLAAHVGSRLVRPVLAGGVEGFRSRGLKAPPVRKELVPGGKWSATSPKADSLAAADLSKGKKPAGEAEASGTPPTPRVERVDGGSRLRAAHRPFPGPKRLVSAQNPTTGGARAADESTEASSNAPSGFGSLVSASPLQSVGTNADVGESIGAPPTTGGERAADGQKELEALFRDDSPQTEKNGKSSHQHDGWKPNGANGSLDQGEPSRPLPERPLQAALTRALLQGPQKTASTPTPPTKAYLEERVIRFTRVDSSCDSVDVEGLYSGPDFPLMDRKTPPKGKAGNTKKLPGGNPNHLGGSSGDESEDNGGPGQDVSALSKEFTEDEEDEDILFEESQDGSMETPFIRKVTIGEKQPVHSKTTHGNQHHSDLNYEPVSYLKRKHRSKPGVYVPVPKAIKVNNHFSTLASGTDRPTRRGVGATVLVKKNLNHYHTVIPGTVNIETTSIIVPIPWSEIMFSLVYRSPLVPITAQNLNTLMAKKHLFAAGDLNFKNTQCNSRLSKQDGRTLAEHATLINYVVLALEEPTFYPSNYNNLLDLLDVILTYLYKQPEDLHALNELDSDHIPVFCWLQINTNPLNFLLRRNIPSTYWPKYQATLDRVISLECKAESTEKVDNSAIHLTSTLLESHWSSTTYEAPIVILKREYQDLNLLIAQKREARHEWQTFHLPRHRAEYNRLRAQVHRRVKQLKLILWNDYISETVNSGDSVWKITKQLEN
uniref:Endonuclease/exonuclease/phosphatase domain-containing protein n=1 Tax=Timema douglasi TaxID=61478 RepID=A0A7R8VID4_TIMDO|nr:unnamed protein product [Timema douglasi]